MNHCPYRDKCPRFGDRPLCLHATHGPAYGSPWPLRYGDGTVRTGYRVGADDCLKCPLGAPPATASGAAR